MVLKYDSSKVELAKKDVRKASSFISNTVSIAESAVRITPNDLSQKNIIFSLPKDISVLSNRMNSLLNFLTFSEDKFAQIDQITNNFSFDIPSSLNVDKLATLATPSYQRPGFSQAQENFAKNLELREEGGTAYGTGTSLEREAAYRTATKSYHPSDVRPGFFLPGVEYGKVAEWNNSTAATIIVGAQSLLKGVLKVGEGVLNFSVITGSVFATVGTGAVDGAAWLLGMEIGATKKLWETTMAVVTYGGVDRTFDWLYDTRYGQWLDREAASWMKPDSTGALVCESIGYVAGIILLTLATGGIGGAAVGATGTGATVGGIVAKLTFAKTASAIAGMAGMGRATSEAWTDGASIGEGLVYGASRGGWEAAQWYVGSKIGTTVFRAGTSLLHKSTNVGVRALLDGATGLVDVPAMMLLDTIYTGRSFKENWEQSGGWQGMLTMGALAIVTTFIGESGSFRKTRIAASGSTSTPNITSNIPPNNTTVRIDNFIESIKHNSDPQGIEIMRRGLQYINSKNTPEGALLLNYLENIRRHNPNFHIKYSDITIDNWNSSYGRITFSKASINNPHIALHEFGHGLYSLTRLDVLPSDYDRIVSDARKRLNGPQSGLVYDIWDDHKRIVRNAEKVALDRWEQTVDPLALRKSLKNALETDAVGINRVLIAHDFNPNSILDVDILYKYIKDYEVSVITQQILATSPRQLTASTAAVSDILSSVNGSTKMDLIWHGDSYNVKFLYGHSDEYFSNPVKAFHEQIANFTELRLSDNIEGLQILHDVLGKEWYDMMENEFQMIIKTLSPL